LTIKENTPFDSSWITGVEAMTEAEAGNVTQALQLAEKGLKDLQYRAIRPMLALAFARAGETTRAEELADSINKAAPVDTLAQNYLLPAIQAAIKIHSKEPAEAIKILERTKKYDFA
jgi:hypothetical protein